MLDLKRFEPHAHSYYSNIRLLDCINRPKDLIDRALQLGLSGISITDHEALCGHIELNMLEKKIQKEHPDFKIALGNEIYLVNERESGQKYYHFILIAKNKTGHKALRELSSKAWMNSYTDRGMERVPTLYRELREIINKYPNSLIATTACLGGELSTNALLLAGAEKIGDTNLAKTAHDNIVNFVLFCQELFGEDFYIECAPGQSKEQVIVNKRLMSIAKCFNIPMIIGTDAHYLKKEDRFVHKAYLNSKDGDREVDSFYEYSYLQSNEEIFENLKPSFSEEEIAEMFHNSINIYDKIETYDLTHKQTIPQVEVKDYKQIDLHTSTNSEERFIAEHYPVLTSLFNSDNPIERYWVNECFHGLANKKKADLPVLIEKYPEYIARLEDEADIKKTIGEKLGTNMFAYPVTLQHYVDLFWECGSVVGAGRGSSCSGLNHYLLGITQLDPIRWDLPFWRLKL